MENCGCVHEGRYIKAGEGIILEGCLKNCTCHASGQFVCEETNCPEGAICSLHNGVRGCMGPMGECILQPGAQLTSFDGTSGQILSEGIYEIASLCNQNDPFWFRIIAVVQVCHNWDLAAVSTIHIFFKGVFVTVKSSNETWVNGHRVSLPGTISENISISISRHGVVIDMGSEVKVLLRPCGEVKVEVSESLGGKLCASCGNFNGNGADDLMLPNGKTAGNIAEVIDAWKAMDFYGCKV
nr:IgGFc-binding protein-like [Anolis sagrei ordinatus]